MPRNSMEQIVRTALDKTPLDWNKVPKPMLARTYVNMAESVEDKLEALAWLEITVEVLEENNLTLEEAGLKMSEIIAVVNKTLLGGTRVEKNTYLYISQGILDRFQAIVASQMIESSL